MSGKENDLLKFLYEVNQAKIIKHCGYWVAKVKDPESVAEHSYSAAVIALILAKLEKKSNPEDYAVAALFHDLHETRLLDRHKISTRYLKTPREVEEQVKRDQSTLLPKSVNKELYDKFKNLDYAILKDADYLEMALQAREYYDTGYKGAWDWIIRVEKVLKTKTARALLKKIKTTDSNVWWRGLKEDVKNLKY